MTARKTDIKNISIIGCGAWGTALAQMLAGQNRMDTRVILYARDEGLANTINATHENKKYLPGCPLAKSLTAVANLTAAVSEADMIIMATPAQHFSATLTQMLPHLRPGTPIVNTAKGMEIESGLRLSQIAKKLTPASPYAALSGASFAHEVARGLPTAVTLATDGLPIDEAQRWAAILSSPTFRPYLSDDVIGVEYAGALKNVIAIACGIVHGKKLGENARAAVMIRGMAEITRLAVAAGAYEHTFLGMAGIGDLVLTCSSTASRNFSLGVALGEGQKLDDIMACRVSVTEGVTTAKVVAADAEKRKVDMPICQAVHDLLYAGMPLDNLIQGLLSRGLKVERH